MYKLYGNKWLHFKCPCGLDNYNLGDWLAHWQVGIKLEPLQDHRFVRTDLKNKPLWYLNFLRAHPKIRAVIYFCLTRIEIR